MVNALTTSMMIDSALISSTSLHPLTEMDIADRSGKKSYGYDHPKNVLHADLQNQFTGRDITLSSEHETHFSDTTRLIGIRAARAESRARSKTRGSNERNVCSREKCLVL